MTDAWERNYSSAYSADGLVLLHTYEFRWKDADSRFGVRTPHRQPPFSYAPTKREGLNQATQIRWEPAGASGAVVEGVCYSRLLSAPTYSDGWTGGVRETIQTLVNANFAGTVLGGFWADEDAQAQAWELLAADFSTPLPTWPWQRAPTHFTLGHWNKWAAMCAPGDLTGLHARSEEIAWNGCGITTDALTASLSPDSNAARNTGPLGDRMAAWQRPVGASNLPNATYYRRPSDGGLLASLFYTWEKPGLPDLSAGTYGWAGAYEFGGGQSCRLVDFHFAALPTYRARVWGYWGPYGPLEGSWFVVARGRYGDATTQYVAAPYTVGSDPAYEATCDSTLDLNTLTYPAGTTHLFVGFDPYLDSGSIHLCCVEGEDNTTFPACGTRSDLGGSVYIPGRMLRAGTVADDGTAT